CDQGAGVPDEIRERIFEAFYSTKGRGGTGMGLAMAREVMRRLGGEITVHNPSEGGACFELRFRREGAGSMFQGAAPNAA
ncbi:MAG TPA: HAMP domain-containing sensor histidine kinase, partial [Polyangia bacterium]